MLTRRAVASGCALLVLACGCSGSNNKSSTTTTIPTSPGPLVTRHPPSTTTRPATSSPGTGPVTGPTDSTTTSTSPPPPSSLAALILDEGPAGFVVQPDADADTGPTDLAKATNDDVCSDGRAALISDGFVRGFQRQWNGVDVKGFSSNVFVFLYQFESADGALNYSQHWHSCLLQNTPAGVAVTPFTPAPIPDAVGLDVNDPKFGSTSVILYGSSVFAVQVLVNGGPGVDQSGVAQQLANAQLARLP